MRRVQLELRVLLELQEQLEPQVRVLQVQLELQELQVRQVRLELQARRVLQVQQVQPLRARQE